MAFARTRVPLIKPIQMDKKMSLIKKRRLERLAKINAQNQAAKPANKSGKAAAPVVSKMQQKLINKRAEKAKAEAEKAEAEKVADEGLGSEKTDELENKVDSVESAVDDVKNDVDNQTEKTDEVAASVDELTSDLDSVKNDVSDLEGQVGYLDGRVDDVEYDVQQIKDKLEDSSEYLGNSELETHKAILAASIDEMRDVEEIEDRKAYKAEAIKKLEAFVNGYVKSGAKYPNIVAVWVMVWLFDLDDIAKAVPLALHLASQKIHKMPTRFNSSIYQFIGDDVYDWANARLKANKSAGPYLDDVMKAIESEKWQLSDIVHGKMYAMHGKHLDALAEDVPALEAYEKAMQLNPRAGVKKNIVRLKNKLGKV
ncbi:phage terminase small subunit [Marinomonas transparens]|uniref:t-SNARE coiled-coil homology domain-containing protein n=1 Tax=Marinomonas transparens TaxID=2795388 RepID=A0A934JNT0_9GAMM|nr:phage terminase small subunit [Marinomonas transparens]MBJ7536958.1 hypothetical protein [Marinomonas transparens]